MEISSDSGSWTKAELSVVFASVDPGSLLIVPSTHSYKNNSGYTYLKVETGWTMITPNFGGNPSRGSGELASTWHGDVWVIL